jgi:hypothetical protein
MVEADVRGVAVGTDMVGGLDVDCIPAGRINPIMGVPSWSSVALFERMVASILASPASIVASIVATVSVVAPSKNLRYSVRANSCCAVMNSKNPSSLEQPKVDGRKLHSVRIQLEV